MYKLIFFFKIVYPFCNKLNFEAQSKSLLMTQINSQRKRKFELAQ